MADEIGYLIGEWARFVPASEHATALLFVLQRLATEHREFVEVVRRHMAKFEDHLNWASTEEARPVPPQRGASSPVFNWASTEEARPVPPQRGASSPVFIELEGTGLVNLWHVSRVAVSEHGRAEIHLADHMLLTNEPYDVVVATIAGALQQPSTRIEMSGGGELTKSAFDGKTTPVVAQQDCSHPDMYLAATHWGENIGQLKGATLGCRQCGKSWSMEPGEAYTRVLELMVGDVR